MSDTTANDVHGPLQSGSFSGPTQTVYVQMPEPPADVQEQIQDIWKTVVKSELERTDRQKFLDAWLKEITAQVRDIGARVFRLELTVLVSIVISTGSLMLGIVMLLCMLVTR